MAINEVQGTQQAQPTRRFETRKDTAGNPVSCIWEDRNGDGKLDLYSITKINPTWDGCTHEITYIDRDGDGYFDVSQEKVTSHIKGKNGKTADPKLISNEFDEKSENTKMKNILEPKEIVKKLKSLFVPGTEVSFN